MSIPIDFCYDSLGANPNLGYPNLAVADLVPEQFDTVWPRVLPLRLLMYLQQFGYNFRTHLVHSAPIGAWYPVALAWHDFDCDYFALISVEAKQRARRGEIRFLFYYHEGDHPGRIQKRFDLLCDQHQLPRTCYLFVSANSAADNHRNCYYFNDHEYFLDYINRRQIAPPAHSAARKFEFTALNRIHKWWRATVMSDLWSAGLLDRSLWSYNTVLTEDDRPEDNPISLEQHPYQVANIQRFLDNGPYECDGSDQTKHNDHRYINTDLYLQSYCHLVIETLFDVDQSGGTFLTEKTFKCLKFGQPFVIIGPAGSLAVLRQSGYKVFDHAVDNRYDTIEDNTQRWIAVRKCIQTLQQQDMHTWHQDCLDDVLHNQWLFATKDHGALDRLVSKLTANMHTV
jgi:hypothetical protein